MDTKKHAEKHGALGVRWRWWLLGVVIVSLLALGQYSTQADCPGCCKVYYR